MNLSAHVTRKEFEHSDTAIRAGLDNTMSATQLAKAIEICEKIFEPLRAFVGRPIRINSGFRGGAVNKRIKGSLTSQHMKGEALDLPIGSKEFHYIRHNLPFDQLIAEFPIAGEPTWVHVSYCKGKNRGQILIATKSKGKTVYLPYAGNEKLVNS